jgi:hypothetical protein
VASIPSLLLDYVTTPGCLVASIPSLLLDYATTPGCLVASIPGLLLDYATTPGCLVASIPGLRVSIYHTNYQVKHHNIYGWKIAAYFQPTSISNIKA